MIGPCTERSTRRVAANGAAAGSAARSAGPGVQASSRRCTCSATQRPPRMYEVAPMSGRLPSGEQSRSAKTSVLSPWAVVTLHA